MRRSGWLCKVKYVVNVNEKCICSSVSTYFFFCILLFKKASNNFKSPCMLLVHKNKERDICGVVVLPFYAKRTKLQMGLSFELCVSKELALSSTCSVYCLIYLFLHIHHFNFFTFSGNFLQGKSYSF